MKIGSSKRVLAFLGRLRWAQWALVALWTAVLGVMHNAFVEGLSQTLQQLPAPAPETAAEPARGLTSEAAMRKLLLIPLGVSFTLACTHPETVASPTAPNHADVPTRLPSPSAVTPRTEPGHRELATSPGRLLAPRAADTIAAALRKRGLLAADASNPKDVEKALRAFQQSQDLAETGFPDHETLRKLGIDPKTVDLTTTPRDGGA